VPPVSPALSPAGTLDSGFQRELQLLRLLNMFSEGELAQALQCFKVAACANRVFRTSIFVKLFDTGSTRERLAAPSGRGIVEQTIAFQYSRAPQCSCSGWLSREVQGVDH